MRAAPFYDNKPVRFLAEDVDAALRSARWTTEIREARGNYRVHVWEGTKRPRNKVGWVSIERSTIGIDHLRRRVVPIHTLLLRFT